MSHNKKLQWHPAFYGAMRLELAENKEDLEFTNELILNTMPIRVDMLIVKKEPSCTIRNEIGKLFRIHNLVEYKNPKDSLNYNTIIKAIGYACLYKVNEPHLDDILISEITLTFIRERKPIKLLKRLKKEKFLVEEKYPGIYYVIKEGIFPMQIIVTQKTNLKNHIWINSLNSQISEEQTAQLLNITKELTDLDEQSAADSVWEIIRQQHQKLIQKMREDENMYKAFAEIMKPEIDAAVEAASIKAFDNGFDNGIDKKGIQVFQNMIKRGFSRKEAQALAEISDELVEQAMETLG